MTAKSGEWPAYARDPGGMRHSPLTQINRDNVTQLELAWTYRTGELATYAGTTLASKAAFEATPLMVESMLRTPYVVSRTYLLNFQRGGIPYTKPPWGRLAAVNLKTGSPQFEVPLGFMLEPKEHPEAEQWGSISLGGPMTTAGGLVFIGATTDNHLRLRHRDRPAPLEGALARRRPGHAHDLRERRYAVRRHFRGRTRQARRDIGRLRHGVFTAPREEVIRRLT